MRHVKHNPIGVILMVILALLLPGSLVGAQHATTTPTQQTSATDESFVIENPPVDCEVIDADPFDGIGDNGPYATFNDILLGTLGECRSMAEFDISPFSLPQGWIITKATFEIMITNIEIYGLGVNGETPTSVIVDGYIGNGIEELSDFQAGDGNTLDTVQTPDPQVGQVLSFDVTSFVYELYNASDQYVGITVRAGSFGGLWATEGASYPKLTIETAYHPIPKVTCYGSLQWKQVKPGETVSGSFQVGNIGENGSLLDWKVDSTPNWGNWTFQPDTGTDLIAGQWTTVTVTVVAPPDKKTNYTGNVTIVNTDNTSDFCVIPVYLQTPLHQGLYHGTFLERFFERFPHAFPILRQLLGY
jgi:hypothetical protein